MIFSNARCLLPDGIRDDLDVVVEAGKIVEIRAAAGTSAETIDLRGDYLAPGFIDTHVHGALGADTMEASPEAYRAICDYHASGGTTSLLLTTATAPSADILKTLRGIAAARKELPQVLGAHLRSIPLPGEAWGTAFEFIVSPTAERVREFLQERGLIRLVTLAPEVEGGLEAIDLFRAAGIRVSGGHTDATDRQALAAFARGMTDSTHTFNCMSSMRRDGIYREGGFLEFVLGEPGVLCEVIADGHHVRPTLLRMLYRAKGADGICLITDATAGAGLPEGTQFQLAGLGCVIDDGVGKLADKSVLAGSAVRMIDCVRTMVNEAGIDLSEAVAMATTSPARRLGLEGSKGIIAVGADADLVVLSQQFDVIQTYLGGELLFNAKRGQEVNEDQR